MIEGLQGSQCAICERRCVPSETGYVHPITRKWCCSTGCLRSANAQPNSTCLDGGNVADRARLARPTAAATPKDREIRCPGCRGTVHYVPHDASDDLIDRLLDVHGWTGGSPRVCGSTCAMAAGISQTSAPAPRAQFADRNVMMAHAAARRRQGLPELQEHQGLLPPGRTK